MFLSSAKATSRSCSLLYTCLVDTGYRTATSIANRKKRKVHFFSFYLALVGSGHWLHRIYNIIFNSN